MKQWHRITLSFDGPQTSEDVASNPFRDYRLTITFTKGRRQFVVPGFCAADGKADATGAAAGNQWRAHFTPDETGEFAVQWYNPRTGGALQTGDVTMIEALGWKSIGQPPADADKDWVALVKPVRAKPPQG